MDRLFRIIISLFILLNLSFPLEGKDVPSDADIGGDGVRLPEVVVHGKKYSMLHIIYYVREYSSLTAEYDTVQLFREKMVDIMLPAKRDRKGGWLEPRVLASRSAYRFANYEGLDSVSDIFSAHFSWSDRISLFDCYMFDTEPEEEDVLLEIDLIDERHHRSLMPSVVELLESPVEEFKRFDVRYYLSDVKSDMVTPRNICRVDVDIRSGQGHRNLNRAMCTNDPVDIDTHAEFYVVSKEFLNDSEASKWKNHVPKGEEMKIMPPPEVSPLPSLYADMAYRASLIDPDEIRRNAKNDERLIGPMYNNFTNKNQNFVGRLWDKFKKVVRRQ